MFMCHLTSLTVIFSAGYKAGCKIIASLYRGVVFFFGPPNP